jgi:hypothetical protein
MALVELICALVSFLKRGWPFSPLIKSVIDPLFFFWDPQKQCAILVKLPLVLKATSAAFPITGISY